MKTSSVGVLWGFVSLSCLAVATLAADPKLHLITVATEETDGLRRLRASASLYGHDLTVLGQGETWQGGNMQGPGGGQKVRLLRSHLQDQEFDDHAVIMFVDAYDVILTASANTILRRFFEEFPDNRILFGAEPFCWPDQNLASRYPPVTFGERFLNSGLFLGFAPDILKLLNLNAEIHDHDDDQLFYTQIYLSENNRKELKIGLDSISRIFQNLNGAIGSVTLERDNDGATVVFNKDFNTHPVVIHGNGPSKYYLNLFENYIAGAYSSDGCTRCAGVEIEDPMRKFPMITLAIIIAKPISFLEEFFATVTDFDYPKEKIDLYVYVNQKRSVNVVNNFVKEFGRQYRSVEVDGLESDICEYSARNKAFHHALSQKSEYVFALDGDTHLSPSALSHLLQRAQGYKLQILAPMVVVKGKLFSNFWGAISANGYYERSTDYMDIVEGNLKGYWNVPFVSAALLISAAKLPRFLEAYNYDRSLDADMSFARFCRDYGHFMYVDNQEYYGNLIATDQFAALSEDLVNPEIFDYFSNQELWEKRYIHPEYFHYLAADVEVPLACPDVYDFPFLSLRFCKEIIEVMESFGRWSDGTNFDRRLEGGYENVPTRDIHMNQIGLEQQWLKILDDYVAPMQEKVFTGYYQRPIKANMMFVVRYKPEEQASLRPHHDASTYSIDVALNKKGVDYEGGGVRYHRYNCTVPADEVGWSMLFPGRLTHLHEGLPTTKGTRYILVSFINP